MHPRNRLSTPNSQLTHSTDSHGRSGTEGLTKKDSPAADSSRNASRAGGLKTNSDSPLVSGTPEGRTNDEGVQHFVAAWASIPDRFTRCPICRSVVASLPALLARVEAAQAAVRRVEALAEQLSRSRAGWDAQVAADIRAALADPVGPQDERPARPQLHPLAKRERGTVALDGSAGPPGFGPVADPVGLPTEPSRAAALADLEHVMTLALQAMADNDCCADPDNPDWRGPAVEQFRRDLAALGVTYDEMDRAGLRLDPLISEVGLPTTDEPTKTEHDWDFMRPASTCRRCGSEYGTARWVNCPGPGPYRRRGGGLMFGLEDDELIANLERMRQARCGYGHDRCDCKYGASGNGEETGCPELRQAIKLLSGQRDDVIVMRQRFEESAANTLRKIKHLLAPTDDERPATGEQQ